MASDLPCDGDGNCMKCKATPPEAEVVLCRTCATPWHVQCLLKPPATLAAVADWECPDCDATLPPAAPAPAALGGGGALIASIRAIEADATLTEQEKAKRRQELLSGGTSEEAVEDKKGKRKEGSVLDLLDEKFKCSFCMLLPDRPVTTPCGHNFCLKCFQKWVGQGKNTCVKCRTHIPSHMSSQPRINAALVVAIRMAKTARSVASDGKLNIYHFTRNEDRPEKAFTTERAKKSGKANAASGQIFVTVPPDHFGPILAENDPKRNQGLLVGELWEDRMECRQWGAHLPHVAGIAGQSDVGAQSVALSGGYEDDEDHGEWFLYTGSGGRDLSGNKRTNKNQSFDQTFMKYNEALRVSCKKGYPVRVVRSHKEKRSSYAPEKGVRYDGIYRIEQCWRKVGIQGHKVCRYLFVRCDNEPAPWTSDEHGDRPRPLPAIKELKDATDVTVRKESPAWDYDEEHGWKWTKPPPVSRKPVTSRNQNGTKARKNAIHVQTKTVQERLLKEFHCQICRQVMVDPLTTPCAHNFCKSCLLDSYADQSFVRERTRAGGRTLRAQKITKKCPICPTDISDFLQNPHVNREMMDLIETLKHKIKEANAVEPSDEDTDVEEKSTEEAGSNSVEDNSREEAVEEGKLHEEEPEGASAVEEGTHAESPSNRKRKNAAVRRKPAKKPNEDVVINEAGAAEDGKLNENEPEGASKVGEGTKAESLPDRKRKNAAVRRKPAKKSKKDDDINVADHEMTITDGPTTVDLKSTDVEDTENELKRASSPTGGQSPSSPLHVPTASDD